ncbi:MAG: ABC transporter substrate-binding protein [bacterium]|nr:ABC transporter substrate-binding protein [bacterium]
MKRKFFVVVLLSIMMMMAVGESQAAQKDLDKVILRTNWLWYGSHSVFFLGINAGYYEENGIDLVVKQGNGSGSAVRLVANKDSTFAYGAAAAAINLAAAGAPVVSVATIDGTGVDACIVRPDSGIKTPKDLEGKQVLTTANAGVNLFFPLFLKNAGVDADKVELVNVAESAIVTSYLQNMAPALLGGLDDKPAEIVANGGEEPIGFNYADYGVAQPGYAVVAHKDMVKDNPDLVQRFVDATLKAVAHAEKNPDDAIDALIDWALNMEDNRDQARRVLDVTLSILYSQNNKDKVIGMNVPEDWASALNLMKEYNELETEMAADQFYTNQFIK